MEKRASLYQGKKSLHISENSLYYIVFMGYAEFKNGYPNIRLVNKDAVKYEKKI